MFALGLSIAAAIALCWYAGYEFKAEKHCDLGLILTGIIGLAGGMTLLACTIQEIVITMGD